MSAVVLPYPLTQLLELREARVRQLEAQCAAQSAALAHAENEVVHLDLELRSVAAGLAAEQRQQLHRTAEGRAIAGDLLQVAAHQAGQRLVLERLTAARAVAAAAAERCRLMTEQIASALRTASKQWAVVLRHQQIFLARAKKLEENRTEEDAAEVWQAQRARLTREGGA